tara:strand:+ start:18708 stop:18917 length:210 start_codon:yes stop_codon:yes gene_type:complete
MECRIKDTIYKCDDYRYTIYDARGIPLGRVCEKCEGARKETFRPEVLSDSNYWTDEELDEDPGVGSPGC